MCHYQLHWTLSRAVITRVQKKTILRSNFKKVVYVTRLCNETSRTRRYADCSGHFVVMIKEPLIGT